MSETPTMWHVEPTHPKWPDSDWVVYEDEGEHEKRLTTFTGPDAEARARAYHASLTAPQAGLSVWDVAAVWMRWKAKLPADAFTHSDGARFMDMIRERAANT